MRIKKFYLSVVVSFLLAMVFSSSFSKPSQAQTPIVVSPGQSINSVLSSAPVGSTIQIKAGTYKEQVTITKSMTLTAFGDGPVWVDGECSRTDGIDISSANVTVKGFGVKNTTDAGVRIDNTTTKNVTVDSMTIQDFNCHRTGPEFRAGIAVWYGGSGMRFTNNTIIHGVTLAGGIIPGNSDGIWFKSETGSASGGGHYIAGNTIKGVWDGIGGEKEDDVHGAFDGNTIVENNTVDVCNDDGIQVEGNGANVHVRYNTIKHCSVGFANAPSLIGPVYFEYNNITEGVIGEYGNLACFKVGNSGRPEAGITYFTGNYCNITGDGWAQSNSGMNPIVARNNIIQTGRYVIELSTAPGAGTSFDNDCLYTTDPTRFVKWANNSSYNTFAKFQALGQEAHGTNSQNCPQISGIPSVTPGGPTLTGTIIPTRTPTPIPASPTPVLRNGDANNDGSVNITDIRTVLQNWLQSMTGIVDQYGDGRINAMDFVLIVQKLPPPTPTSGTGPSATPTSGVASPTPTVNPNALIVGSGGYATINAAITAATAGQTIRIKAGTYAGKVTVNKTVTLTAFGDGQVWIDAGCVSTYPADADNGVDNGIAITASNVVIQGLGIKNTRDAAILVDGRSVTNVANVTIDGNTIENTDCKGTGPEYRAGVGVWQANNGMIITNNKITGRPGNATYVGEGDGIWFKSLTADPSGGGHHIAGNTITGVYDGIGGEKEDDARGGFDRDTIIENNIISYCNDDGISPEGGTKNIRVRSNNISHCAIGIANAPNLIGPIYFENNVITQGRPGAYGNNECFKVGNYQPDLIPASEVGHENGHAYYTGNTCTGILDNGWAQTNAPVGSIISRNNKINVGRYVVEINSPASGATFSWDLDCVYTPNTLKFAETPGGNFATFGDWKASGQETNGQSNSNCGLP